MGNQNSFSNEKNGSDDKLLRRNMRSVFSNTASGNAALDPYSGASDSNFLDSESQRQSRSRSLEPRTTQEIRSIEHSKSMRYGARYKKKHSAFAVSGSTGGVPTAQLWNPEEQRLELLRLQLQNPQHGSRDSDADRPKLSLSQLKDEEFRRQLRTIVLMNKRNDSVDTMDNNVTEHEHIHRSITGLSTHQTQMLQKLWARAKEHDVMDCTRNIFTHLLRSNMHMYQFFNLTDKTDKEIMESTTFARQSANFAMVMDYVITNMSDLEKVCFALQCLGERHSRLPYAVENSHWQLFMRVFEDNPPKIVFQNAEGHTVWKTMIGFIIQQMRMGYDRVAPDSSDPNVQRLSAGSGCPLTEALRRPKSAQSQNSDNSAGIGEPQQSRHKQFASQKRYTTSHSISRSRRASNNHTPSSGRHIFKTTTSCV